MLLVYVLFMTAMQAALPHLMHSGGFSRGFLSSVEVKAEAETGRCVCARQQLPLHRGSGAQTAVSHVEMWEEGKKSVGKTVNVSL